MDIQKKYNIIKYTEYKYTSQKWNAEETKDFFDLSLSRLIFENINDIINSQEDLLSYFDFQKIFNNYDNGITEIQSILIKFMAIKGVKDLDLLLQNLPYHMKEHFLYQFYNDLKSNSTRPFWFSATVFCLMDNEKELFINKIIDEANDDEIFYLIQELYENEKDLLLTKLFTNERIANIAIQRINAPFFYEMLKKLNLPNDFLIKRENELKSILFNYQEYNPKDVKKAFAELYFHDTLNNVYLDIETIVDFANSNNEIKESLGNLYDIFAKLVTFFSNEAELTDLDIKILETELSINQETLSKVYTLCEKKFKSLIVESIQKNVYEGITPRIKTSSSGKEVKIYDIENQGKNQQNVTMLISTIPIYGKSVEDFIKGYYSNENNEVKYHRRCFSLINQKKLTNLFNSKRRISFGYEDLSNRKIICATLRNGGTDGNDIRFRKKRRVKKNSLLPVNQFIDRTKGHNEILLEEEEILTIIKPTFILIREKEPTQLEIDIAAYFNIPIRYVNAQKYEQTPDVKEVDTREYKYIEFEREIINKQKTIEI